MFDFTKDMTRESQLEREIKANKQLRKDLDASLQNLKSCPRSRERVYINNEDSGSYYVARYGFEEN